MRLAIGFALPIAVSVGIILVRRFWPAVERYVYVPDSLLIVAAMVVGFAIAVRGLRLGTRVLLAAVYLLLNYLALWFVGVWLDGFLRR